MNSELKMISVTPLGGGKYNAIILMHNGAYTVYNNVKAEDLPKELLEFTDGSITPEPKDRDWLHLGAPVYVQVSLKGLKGLIKSEVVSSLWNVEADRCNEVRLSNGMVFYAANGWKNATSQLLRKQSGPLLTDAVVMDAYLRNYGGLSRSEMALYQQIIKAVTL